MIPDLSVRFCGVEAPNPFWLASAPPTNSGYQVRRAYEAGWGGVVWKTLNHEPIVNVSSRYGAIDYDGRKVMGLNNIELITDRPLEDNLREIREVKRDFPKHALFVSLMVESKRETWHDIVKRTQDTGCDGLELNFGCPHGMSERGMGSAVGQVPEYTEMITSWVKEAARIPVLVKLTPNISDVRTVARAAKNGGADGVSLINTINSIMGIDLDTFAPKPAVAGKGSHGGYCGPAVKPIALNMVSAIATDPATKGLPISGIGGIQAWPDAVEYILLGAGSVQVCTAVMHYGFRIVEHMISGLKNWMREKNFARIEDFRGRAAPNVVDWGDLDLGYKVVAEIDQSKCIHCGICYIACEDGCHQSINWEKVPVAEFAERFAANGVVPSCSSVEEPRTSVRAVSERDQLSSGTTDTPTTAPHHGSPVSASSGLASPQSAMRNTNAVIPSRSEFSNLKSPTSLKSPDRQIAQSPDSIPSSPMPQVSSPAQAPSPFINPDMHVTKSGGVRSIPGEGAGYIGVFTIKQHTCVGCNMCSLVCPVQNCITMNQVPSHLPSMSWREYQKKLAAGEVQKIQPPEHV